MKANGRKKTGHQQWRYAAICIEINGHAKGDGLQTPIIVVDVWVIDTRCPL